jgi:tRNA pseudouridine55 synthase
MELGDAYCLELRRTAISPFEVAAASDTVVPLDDALHFMPAVRLGPEEAERASHGVAVPAPGGTRSAASEPFPSQAAVRLVDQAGLIAIAEPRGGRLKPVVGFRG